MHAATRWFFIDVLTLGPDWALEIVAWSSPNDLAECHGKQFRDNVLTVDGKMVRQLFWLRFFYVKHKFGGREGERIYENIVQVVYMSYYKFAV